MKNLSKILSLILALTMIASCFGAFAVSAADDESEQEIVTDFSDVDKNSKVGEAVTELALRGIVTGYPDGTYLPEGNVTRAEFAVVCVRLANLADGIGTDAVTHFTDLDADDSYKWARPYVAMASAQGIIDGYEDNTFRAGDPVTYEQAVKMLMSLKGWKEVCEEETKRLQSVNVNSSWSAGYMAYALQEGLLKNTNSNSAYLSQPINRGVVAILAYNSLSLRAVEKVVNPITNEEVHVISGSLSGSSSGGGSSSSDSNVKTVSGVITATYVTALDNAVTDLGKYEIVIDDDDTYEVDHKLLDSYNLCELIGQRIKATYNKKDEEITAISLNPYKTKEIYSGVSGDRDFFVGVNDDGAIEYCTNLDKYKVSKVTLPKNAAVIFNGKYVDDFETEDLIDPSSPYYFTNGLIEIIDGKTDVVRISNYKTYVVKNTSRGTSGTEKLNLLYKTGTEASMDFRVDAESGEYFKFSRNGKTINSLSDISAYDVISVMESPEDAPGFRVTVMEATRNSKTGQKVNGVNQDDENIVELNGAYYTYNYDYRMYDPEFGNEDKHTLARGDEGVSVYLDYMGQIAHVAISSSSSSTSYKYGYLFSMSQDKEEFLDEDAKYNMEVYLMLEDGSKVQVGTTTTVYIDGKKYNSKDTSIANKLKAAAEKANEAYLNSSEGADVTGLEYQQPIRYKRNSSGLISAIDTVADSDDDDLVCDAPYNGKRSYTTSSGFSDFNVSSQTKIFFIPDDRTDWDEYSLMKSSTFTSGRKYYVEGYDVATSSIGNIKRASFVLLYKTNDSDEFNYKSPFLIVSNTGRNDKDEDFVSGYNCSGASVATTATTTLVVDTDKVSESLLDDLHKGDIVRYIKNSSGQIVKMERWFDSVNPVQGEAVSSVSDALENRILAMRSTSDEPVSGDYAAASFRLAYGTVLDFDETESVMLVSPTLHKDDVEMATIGAGVVAHKFSTSKTSPVKVFVYNGTRLGAEYISENGMSGVRPYSEYGEGADIVITYSTGDTTTNATYLRFVYFINR